MKKTSLLAASAALLSAVTLAGVPGRVAACPDGDKKPKLECPDGDKKPKFLCPDGDKKPKLLCPDGDKKPKLAP